MWSARMYRYPVEDAYRFHFKKPRDVSPWRVADVPPARPSYYSYKKDKPQQPAKEKSERAEFEFMQTKGITTKDAPFGTLDTPNITMKIIGSEYKPVIEKHPNYNEDYSGSRLQPLEPIPNPPQRSDPRDYDDMPGGIYSNTQNYEDYYEQTEELEHPHSAPTALISKRPDSKDLSRSQYKVLPKVLALRKRNDTSTIFEREPWAPAENPPLARETEYKQNYQSDLPDDMEFQEQLPERLYVTDSEKHSLTMLVPRNVLLPSDPIVLTREHEIVLCKLICIDLEGFDEKKLKEIYLDASLRDPDLNGYCDIQYLDSVLRQHGAYMSADTFRVLAAQFVSPAPRKENKVNYEKILSFIGSALQLNRKGQLRRSPRRLSSFSNSRTEQPAPVKHKKQQIDTEQRTNDGKPKYYQDVADLAKSGFLYKDQEVAKLLRTVEQELSKSTYVMDWTKWYDAFNAKDREHRETLSAAQIKDICYDLKLPLSASLQNHILVHCEDKNGDGQYNWHAFLDFLSRVRPSNTGLPIPVSKRPLEYAKHYPAPVANWPRADGVLYEQRPPPRKDPSPQRREYYERNDPSPRQNPPSPRRPQDDRDKFSYERIKPAEKPIFREKSPPVDHTQMNGSPEMDLQPEFDRTEERDGRNSRHPDDKPRYIPSWQERHSRLDDTPHQDLDPRFRDHNYRTYPPKQERPRSHAERFRPEERTVQDRETHNRNRSLSPIRYRSPPPPVRNQSPDKRRNYDNNYRYGDRGRGRPPGAGYGRDDNPPTQRLNRDEQIRELSEQLKHLETTYKITKEAISSNRKPWLDRYLKLAHALYNSDISNRGCLPKREVHEIVQQYNKAFNLKIDDFRVSELMTDPKNLDRSGNVLLQPFLSKLSA